MILETCSSNVYFEDFVKCGSMQHDRRLPASFDLFEDILTSAINQQSAGVAQNKFDNIHFLSFKMPYSLNSQFITMSELYPFRPVNFSKEPH